MDFYSIEEGTEGKPHKYQTLKTPIGPFYAPFYPQWRKHLAKQFYVLASRLEPKHYPPQRLKDNGIKGSAA